MAQGRSLLQEAFVPLEFGPGEAQVDWGDAWVLSEGEERKGAERRIRAAQFPAHKTLEAFDFLAAPGVNKKQILELSRGEWIDKRENLIFLGNPGTGKTHLAVALGACACQRGYTVRFLTAAALVNALAEARDEKALLRLQARLAKIQLLIVDELGYALFAKTGAELLFEAFSQCYERGSVLATSNLPFEEWTAVFGSERLTGALLDRLTHRADRRPILLPRPTAQENPRQRRQTTRKYNAAGLRNSSGYPAPGAG